jgi:nifR3 family TIM-barrel protein
MVEAVKIPVTCKMRLGWDEENLTAPDLAGALEEVGAAAIMVHGRTRQQGFEGSVNLAGIRRVAAAVKTIPVIGNGDITTPQAAKVMLDSTGCTGVSIGRGAFYNPWVFAHTKHYLETGELLPEAPFDERLRVMNRHYDLMVEVFGETMGSTMFRKVGPWYSKRFGPASMFNKRVVQVSTRADYEALVRDYVAWRAQFLDGEGNLLPRYAPAPQAINFRDDDEPAVARRESIPVPAGPNELW